MLRQKKYNPFSSECNPTTIGLGKLRPVAHRFYGNGILYNWPDGVHT